MNKQSRIRSIDLYSDIRQMITNHIETNIGQMTDPEYYDLMVLDNEVRLKVDRLKKQVDQIDRNIEDQKALAGRMLI